MNTWNMCQQISPMTRLTSDKATITAGIEAMKAENSGRYTYVPTGLMWGWRAISNLTPFADGVAYTDNSVQKVIILMTDGANTLTIANGAVSSAEPCGEMWGHDQKTTPAPLTDSYTAETCENIKAKGIVLHTIAFEVAEGSPVETLMRNCAETGDNILMPITVSSWPMLSSRSLWLC